MDLNDLQTTWDAQGRTDPLWAVLSDPSKKGRRWDAEEFFATGVREVERLIDYLRGLSGAALGRRAALDFGCGVGRLTQPLAEYFTEVVGVDLSPSMIDLAQKYNRHPERCHYYVNASADLARFPTGSFDLVLSYLTLQHIPPRYTKRYIQEFLRVATTGGLVCFQLPTRPAAASDVIRVPVWRLKSGVRALLARIGVGNGARIAMYGVTREAVRRILQESRGRLLDLTRVDGLTPEWEGYRYVASKE
jgi:SAM-dependent methyltransferase